MPFRGCISAEDAGVSLLIALEYHWRYNPPPNLITKETHGPHHTTRPRGPHHRLRHRLHRPRPPRHQGDEVAPRAPPVDIDIAHTRENLTLTITPTELGGKPITATLTPEQVPELVRHLIVELGLMNKENQS